jgi:hypothetical protein
MTNTAQRWTPDEIAEFGPALRQFIQASDTTSRMRRTCAGCGEKFRCWRGRPSRFCATCRPQQRALAERKLRHHPIFEPVSAPGAGRSSGRAGAGRNTAARRVRRGPIANAIQLSTSGSSIIELSKRDDALSHAETALANQRAVAQVMQAENTMLRSSLAVCREVGRAALEAIRTDLATVPGHSSVDTRVVGHWGRFRG